MNNKKILIIAAIVVAIVIVGIVIIFKMQANNKEYESPLTVEYNYFKVYTNGKYGVLNKNGEMVVPANYDDVVMPNPSKAVFMCIYNYNKATEEYDYILLNDKAEAIFTQFNNVEAIPVTGIIGTVPYEKWALEYMQDGKYGLVGIDGNKITDAKYEEIASVPYKEGVFLIKENNKYGVINNRGVYILQPEYDSIIGDGIGNKNSCFIVKKGEYTGFMDEYGEEILAVEYDSIYRIGELTGMYLVAQKNGQYGLLNKKQIIIGFNYQMLNYDSASNLIVARRNTKYGVINTEGNRVLPIEFDNVYIEGIYIIATKDGIAERYLLDGHIVENAVGTRVDKTSGGYYITIDSDNNYGVLDTNMNVIINNRFEYLEYLYDDLFIARNADGKYGIINAKQRNIIDFEYDILQLIKNTKIVQAIKLNSAESPRTMALYNENIEKIYEEINPSIYTYNDYIRCDTETNTVYFSKAGQEVQNTEVYSNNAFFAFKADNKWGYKDKNGNVIIEANYEKATDLNGNGFAGIKENGKWGVIDSKGNIIIEPTYEIKDVFYPEFLNKYYRINELVYTDVIGYQET